MESSSRRLLLAAALVAIGTNVIPGALAQAEPLTPLTQAELQYLEQVRRVFSVSPDNAAARSDGELLDAGRRACGHRADGYLGYEATRVSPIIAQLAFVYLCPR